MEKSEMQEKFIKRQNELIGKINLKDAFNIDTVKLIAGVDLAYWVNNDRQEYAVCCIVIVDKATHKLIETKSYSEKIEVPYMPGFLAFRELPLVIKTAKLIENKPFTLGIWGSQLMPLSILMRLPLASQKHISEWKRGLIIPNRIFLPAVILTLN